MSKFRKILALILCIFMLTVVLAGCADNEETKAPGTDNNSDTSEEDPSESSTSERETLSVGATNLKMEAYEEDWWPSDFFDFMQETLNINFEWIEYDTDTSSLALASGELPDLMLINDSRAVLDGKLAIAMDDYLDEYGPNIKKNNIRNEMIRKYHSNGDSKLYFHTPNSGGEDLTGGTEIWNGNLVRWDLYKEIGAPEMKNDDDYINVLKQMQDLYPTTENGDPVYGIGIHNDSGLWGWNMRAFANQGFSNVNSWNYAVNTNTNDLYSNFLDTENGPFWSNMEFYNKLYLEGLLDPDSFTMKAEEVKEKASKGQYLGGYCQWYIGEFYETEREKDPSTLKGIISVPVAGQNGWYGQNALVGWSDKLLFITNKCENIPLAVKFIDFLDSEEGNRAHYSGIEGKHWKYNTEGIPEVLPETLTLRTQGGDEWSKTGISSFANIIGFSAFGTHSDGQYYSLFDDPAVKAQTLSPLQKDFSEFYGVEYPAQLHYNMVLEGKATNQQNALHSTINMGVTSVPTDIARIDSQSEEIVSRAVPSLVQAKDAAEFDAAKTQVLADLEKANAQHAWDWWKTQWDESKTYVESLGD